MDLCLASRTKVTIDQIAQSDDRKYPEMTCPDCGAERVSLSPKYGEAKDGLYTITRHQPKGTASTATATAKQASPSIPSDPLTAIRSIRDRIVKEIESGPTTLVKNTALLADLRTKMVAVQASIDGHQDRLADLEQQAQMYNAMLTAATAALTRDTKVIVVAEPAPTE